MSRHNVVVLVPCEYIKPFFAAIERVNARVLSNVIETKGQYQGKLQHCTVSSNTVDDSYIIGIADGMCQVAGIVVA